MKNHPKVESLNNTARNPKTSTSQFRSGARSGGGPGPHPIKPMPKDFSAGKFRGMKP